MFAFPAICADSIRIDVLLLKPEIIQQRLEAVPRKLAERRAVLESFFNEAGCGGSHLSAQAVPHSKQPNVICEMPGETAGAIVVGGHYDAVDVGMGAVDDWSGSSLLPSLYQSLSAKPRRHRFVFIAFSGEEEGLFGSKQYVKQLGAEKSSVRAMVNLECLGMTPPKVWAHRANKDLLTYYALVAKSVGAEVVGSNVERIGDDDSHPFLDAKIPVITIHSLTQETFTILHSSRDKVSAIHPADYYAAYRLTANYLAYLDAVLE